MRDARTKKMFMCEQEVVQSGAAIQQETKKPNKQTNKQTNKREKKTYGQTCGADDKIAR